MINLNDIKITPRDQQVLRLLVKLQLGPARRHWSRKGGQPGCLHCSKSETRKQENRTTRCWVSRVGKTRSSAAPEQPRRRDLTSDTCLPGTGKVTGYVYPGGTYPSVPVSGFHYGKRLMRPPSAGLDEI